MQPGGKDNVMSDNGIVDPITALTTPNKNNLITRKNHSHPAAYALHHAASGQMYVGSTENLYIRVNKHRTQLEVGKHRNANLQEAFNQDCVFQRFF